MINPVQSMREETHLIALILLQNTNSSMLA